jgi:phosphoserine phosphatase
MKRNTIAIVYDFDGTLSPQPMQEYTVFPQLQLRPEKFWAEVKRKNAEIRGEEIITYMMLMLERANEVEAKISRTDLGRMASAIEFFPGVEDYFKRINEFVATESGGKIKLRHYILSSGLKEIINKTKIKNEFYNIFASEYYYDQYGAPKYPKLVVTDTVKTQFLFRINKGKEKLTESINEFMPDKERPIPFSNIIYVGDGMTDVPCMTVTTKNGGSAIAVYKPHSRTGLAVCKKLFKNARVDYIAPANYSKGSKLNKFLQTILKAIIQGIIHYNTQRDMTIEYRIKV